MAEGLVHLAHQALCPGIPSGTAAIRRRAQGARTTQSASGADSVPSAYRAVTQ